MGMSKMINQFLIKEWADQGHYLTGTFNQTLEAKIETTQRTYKLDGYAVDYAKIVDEGIPANKIKSSEEAKLVNYFVLKGFGRADAERIAHLTMRKWKREGMPTQASKRFSKTGSRLHFVEAAFTGHAAEMDEYFFNNVDLLVDEQYRKTKSETI